MDHAIRLVERNLLPKAVEIVVSQRGTTGNPRGIVGFHFDPFSPDISDSTPVKVHIVWHDDKESDVYKQLLTQEASKNTLESYDPEKFFVTLVTVGGGNVEARLNEYNIEEALHTSAGKELRPPL